MNEFDERVEAIDERFSCRAFEKRAVEQGKADVIATDIARINRESGLHFQLYGPRDDGFVIEMNSSMFANNPPLYAALVGPDNYESQEQLGYYGEQLVLLVQRIGLASCWVASTYNQETTRAEIAAGEKLHDVIPIGYAPAKQPLKQRTIRSAIRARNKKLDALWNGPSPLASAPEWIQASILAVHKGPSAANEQPVVFVQEEDGGPICATLSQQRSGQEITDLGIAKCHFELAARACGVPGTWEWGAGGAYVLDPAQ